LKWDTVDEATQWARHNHGPLCYEVIDIADGIDDETLKERFKVM
jgi:hypothetical protein